MANQANTVDPRSQDWGLCRRAYERDSCGFGLIASLDDRASHWVVQTAITSLNRLTHRGAIATDGKTGDGCGLLLKTPTQFLRAVAREAGFSLRPQFAAGLVFLNRDPAKAAEARRVLTAEIEREKMQVAGFRVVNIDPAACGDEALKSLPHIEQIFVNSRADIDEAAFNRALYMARRRAEKLLDATDPAFYVPSLSASTIVYKGMVMPQHLVEFYPDLADPRCSTSASRPTRCLSGGSRTRTATWPTTARSIPCRAIARGPWPAARCSAPRSCPTSPRCCRWYRSPGRTPARSTTCSSCCWWGASIRCMRCAC